MPPIGSAVVVLAALVAGEGGFLKGQLHLHSNHSGDGHTPPAEVVRWYDARGYDFIVFTDHNWVTVEPSTARLLVLPGAELTQNVDDCTPPSANGRRCPLHVNALVVKPEARGAVPWPPTDAKDRLTIYRRELDLTRRLGGVAQLNHPNFHSGADAPVIVELARGGGLALLEIANQASDSNNHPGDGRPSTEQLWDDVLGAGVTVYGTATDDAHNFDDAEAARARGEMVFTGDRGFVMVRAEKNAGSIRAALARGDFYASTGVLLSRLDHEKDGLVVEVAARSPGPHHFELVGAGGKIMETSEGRRASFSLAGVPPGGYARVVVTDGAGRRAWGQPVRVR